MPNRLHPAKWGPKDTRFDTYISNLITERGYGFERHYIGVATRERAEEIRRGLRTAGRHLGVAVKAFWRECAGCDRGGADCRYHVSFTAYSSDAARAYKERQADTK